MRLSVCSGGNYGGVMGVAKHEALEAGIYIPLCCNHAPDATGSGLGTTSAAALPAHV